ncbi:proteophosphoglycan ppg4 [Rhodotorula toruloides]|uniref:Proteophosphoglycan ppg4 n=1 Tax=Rhodotorula toruloides TaxID=5286 RepID=A0A511KBB1_RHOTO|nr:proteophosphoglycan ppg4 [Rhodotorula toruloides]
MTSLDPQIHLLVALCTVPLASLPTTLANPPVHDTLCALLAHSKPSRSDIQQRQLLHAVVARAAPLKGALAGPQGIRLLALYLAAFLSTSAKAAQKVVEDALAANVRLAEQIRSIGGGAIQDVFGATDGGEAARTVLALVRGTVGCLSPTAAGAKGGEAARQVLEALVAAYERLASSSSIRFDSLRIDALDTSHALVQTTATALISSTNASTSSTALEALRLLLLVLLPLSKPPTALARALQVHYFLSNALTDAIQGSVGPVARQVKDLIGGLKRAASGDEAEKGEREWVVRLAREKMVGGAAERDVGEGITKVAAVDGQQQVEELGLTEKDAGIASAVSHLLDLFPHLSPPFLRACLVHPTFTAATLEATIERVVAALLDDSPLPPYLARMCDDSADPEPKSASATLPTPTPQVAAPKVERHNIYDNDRLFSRGTLLVGGKDRKLASQNKKTPPALKLDESLKASIIAIAEAPSSDEEEEEGEAFLEDGAEDGDARVRVGDGEPKDLLDEDEEGDEVAMGDGPQGGGTSAGSSAPITTSRSSSIYPPATVLTLESTYLRSPALFNRDAATRRGKERKALREKTGLGDEQIEGWKVMLERDPKKLQELSDKHIDLAATSNRPASQRPLKNSAAPDAEAPSLSASQQQQQHQQRGPPRSGGESSRGGSRGRGRSDGGRKTSDRATRGRDKKLAKFLGAGGGGVA